MKTTYLQQLMNKRQILVIASFYLLFTACHSQINDLSIQDAAEIKQVIEEESSAYLAGDLDRWKSVFAPESETSYTLVSPASNGGILHNQGYEAVVQGMKEQIAAGNHKASSDLEKLNWQFTGNGDLAYVSFDSKGKWNGINMVTKEFRLMKKIDGQWKISQNIVAVDEAKTDQGMRGLSGDNILWITSFIKADHRADYEKWINDVFYPALYQSSIPTMPRQLIAARLLTPTAAEPDGSYAYTWLMDPAVEGADYDILPVLTEAYGAEKAKDYIDQLDSWKAKGDVVRSYVQK